LLEGKTNTIRKHRKGKQKMIELLLISELLKPIYLEPEQAKQNYSYVSMRRAGSGRRVMRKENKQVQTWTLEWTAPGQAQQTRTFTSYDECNARAKALDAAGAYVSRWCIDNWNHN
jgi:hypothetical protein